MNRPSTRLEENGVIVPVFDEHYLRELYSFIPSDIFPSKAQKALALSTSLIEVCFGRDWVERHIFSENKNPFLVREDNTRRISDLAEFIINLTPVAGSSSPFNHIKNGQIESAFAELEVGRLLTKSEIYFEFIIPSGAKGEDFDLCIQLRNNFLIAADTKCKIEGNNFSSKSVEKSLDTARKNNISKDKCGAVFIKYPQEWWVSENLSESTSLFKQYLEKHERILSIVIFSSRIDERSGIPIVSYRHIETARFNTNADFRILTFGGCEPSKNGLWKSISSLVNSYEEWSDTDVTSNLS